MKKTKNELDFASLIREKYGQARKRVKIYIKGEDAHYVGMIITDEIIIGQVEVSDANSVCDSYKKVPIKIKFKIKDITSEQNGKIVEIDVFSIKNISFFD